MRPTYMPAAADNICSIPDATVMATYTAQRLTAVMRYTFRLTVTTVTYTDGGPGDEMNIGPCDIGQAMRRLRP